jgi:ABC-2 type transport system permease protein
MFRRLLTLIRKEFQIILGDKQARLLVVMPVILQTALFPLAATLEIKNATLAIYDQDGGPAAIELAQRLRAQTTAFTAFIDISGEQQLNDTIERQRALAVVRIPPDFSRRIAAMGEMAAASAGGSAAAAPQLQLLLDGRRTNAGQIAAGYIQQIAQTFQQDLAGRRAGAAAATPPSALVAQNWFNPNLDYLDFLLPCLIALITTTGILIVTTLSVAREREQGTFEQLLVSPYTPEMIMAGKLAPALVIAMFQATLILIAAVFIYQVPFQGSLLLLYAGITLYALALAGVGLFISALCATQQQAFISMFAFMMPAMILSGFAAPVENMPVWLQHLTWINPIRHFMELVKAIYLKNATPAHFAALSWPLLVIGAITLGSAAILFRKKTT